jgi:DNA-binding NarL/FixJ family response regulator
VIRVLLVDDQALVRAGLRLILEPQDGMTIVGECEDGDQVLEAVERLRPDVVLMDVRMRRMDGAEATSQLRSRAGSPPVLILTTFDDEETVAAALGAGAAGFLLKDASGWTPRSPARSWRPTGASPAAPGAVGRWPRG